MIDLAHSAIFNSNRKTLRETSLDDSDSEIPQYMTNSDFPAIDFDGVKNSYTFANSAISASKMRSNDALVILDSAKGKFLFVEFKNGDVQSKPKKEEIRSKIAESLLILNDIIDENLSFDRKNVDYILVYNRAKNPKFQSQRTSSLTKIATAIGVSANMDYLIDGFDRYRAYFHDIKTINETEFSVIANQLQTNTYNF